MPLEGKQILLAKLRASRSTSSPYQNDLLESAIETCISARSLIESEQAKLEPLIESAGDPITRAAREYQRDLIAWQLTRAADIALERRDYLKSITDRNAELEKCKVDILHWFRYYAWALDPRPDVSLAVMPLAPFDFQRKFIKWVDDLIFTLHSSGVGEKSRDMGATVMALGIGVHHWRFIPHFSTLLTSEKEDLVDAKKDLDTLFEKVRFTLRHLPGWMLPIGFSLERDMPYMNIANPVEGGVITGSAPTERVGQQRRRSLVIADEFASWPAGGFPQHQTLTQTTKSLLALGTPKGKFNKYADLTHDNVTPKFEMDWRDHPWKDERWYNSLPFGILCPAMTVEDIAQEIDRNYEASQPGRVLKNVREEYCFITEDELIAAFPGRDGLFYDSNGNFRLPSDWNWGRVADYGESAQKEDDTHIWAYSLFARPAERWPRWAVDSLFFFISRPIEPIGATELEGFACYSEWERQIGVRGTKGLIRTPQVNDMSHEAADPKAVLLKKCGDNWRIPDLDFDKGRRKLVYHFEVTDKHLINPVRSELMGRCRIYFVAPKDSYQLAHNDRTGSYFVTPSANQAAFKRLRAEIPSWHYPPEERGKPVPKMRPKSVFDDVVTTMRYAVARWGISPEEKTINEKIIDAMPEQSRPEAVKARSPLPKGLTPELQLEMELERHKAAQKIKPNRQYFDENLKPINMKPTMRYGYPKE